MGSNGQRRRHRVMPAGGNDDFDDGSGVRIRQSQTASEFIDALPHSADANPDTVGTKLNHLLFNSFAIVAHRHDNAAVISPTTLTLPLRAPEWRNIFVRAS